MTEMTEEEWKQLNTFCKRRDEFKDKLIKLINEYGLENDTNTPDFIIANVMINSYLNMNELVLNRDNWYNVHLEPGKKYFEKEEKE